MSIQPSNDDSQAERALQVIRRESASIARREVSAERLSQINTAVEQIATEAATSINKELGDFKKGFADEYETIETDRLMKLELLRELSPWPAGGPAAEHIRSEIKLETQENASKTGGYLHALWFAASLKMPWLGKLFGAAS